MKVLRALIMSVAMAGFLSAAGEPTEVTYVPHDKVADTLVKGGAVVKNPGFVVLAQRRKAGEVEVHGKTNHVFIIVDGEATLVAGGKLVGGRQTAPNQWRGPSIDGGQTYHLSKGDIIVIPANTPHWFKEVPTGTIGYYAVNSDTE